MSSLFTQRENVKLYGIGNITNERIEGISMMMNYFSVKHR